MVKVKTIAAVSVGFGLVVTSIAAVAGPNSKSPFASNKKKAWETNVGTNPAPAPHMQMPSHQTPNYQPQQSGASYQSPSANYRQPRPQVQTQRQAQPNGYYPGKQPANAVPAWAQTSGQAPIANQAPFASQSMNAPTQYPQNYRSQIAGQQNYQPAGTQNYQPAGTQNYQPAGTQNYQGQNVQLRGASKPSFAQRFGFGNIQTELSGHAKIGVALADRPGQDASFESAADFDVRGEVNAITDGGLEYGAGLRVRAQRDRYRRGFGGRVGDCPATNPACASVLVGANTRNVKGHTGQFFTGGPADIKETEIALEGAYLFLRSSYGDFVLGRDDGAAYLFSLGAPSVAMVGASNSRVDYTGLDSVKTYNNASGFAEKISYTSPRLLGDTVGVGVQFGLSYAPSAKACGVDYCVRENGAGAGDIFAPEIKNVIEAGLSLDRKFSNGVAVELTGTYAHGSEKTGNAVFSNLSTWGAGLELKYADLTLGTSYLKSNNGFATNGDYTAYDIGVQWKPSNWGFSASYGHATDNVARLSSNQGVLAASYDFGTFTLGSGVQYIKRKTPLDTIAGVVRRNEDAVALFIEAGIKF